MPSAAISLPCGLDAVGRLLVLLASVAVCDEAVLDRLAGTSGICHLKDERGESHWWLALDDEAFSEVTGWPADLVTACALAERA
mgnify:CR=1 FL=1